MIFIKNFLFTFLTFLSISHAMDTDNQYLARHYVGVGECCNYYSKESSISFEGDPVYSTDYTNINDEITEHCKFLQKLSTHDRAVNFMTVVLSATGINENGKIKRVFDNIYVNCGKPYKKNNTNGIEIMQDPGIFTHKEEGTKILVFSSKNQSCEGKYYFVHEFKHFHIDQSDSDSRYNLFNFNSFSGENKIVEDMKEFVSSEIQSHTEPLWISALKTLPDNPFKKMLNPKYKFQYYEIHLISSYDACNGCSQYIFNEINNLKEKFGKNLFMFFHSNETYYKSDYSIKRNGKYYPCKESEEGFNSFIKENNFEEIPDHYFSIIHSSN